MLLLAPIDLPFLFLFPFRVSCSMLAGRARERTSRSSVFAFAKTLRSVWPSRSRARNLGRPKLLRCWAVYRDGGGAEGRHTSLLGGWKRLRRLFWGLIRLAFGIVRTRARLRRRERGTPAEASPSMCRETGRSTRKPWPSPCAPSVNGFCVEVCNEVLCRANRRWRRRL